MCQPHGGFRTGAFHRATALITKDTATEIDTKVSRGATTGSVTVTTLGGTATNTTSFNAT